MGIGGAVIFSTIKGQGSQKDDEAGEVFTVSVIGSILLALLSWFVIVVFDQPLLTFFGAEKNLLPLGLSYLKPIQFVVPCFLFNQMLAAYLRNDNDPALATAGVLSGGIFNILEIMFLYLCLIWEFMVQVWRLLLEQSFRRLLCSLIFKKRAIP